MLPDYIHKSLKLVTYKSSCHITGSRRDRWTQEDS